MSTVETRSAAKKRKTAPGAAAAGGSRAPNGRRRGMFAQMRFSKAQPWGTYGAMRVERGTSDNVSRFGETFKSATAAQRAARAKHGYAGRGIFKKLIKGATKLAKKTPMGQMANMAMQSGMMPPHMAAAASMMSPQFGAQPTGPKPMPMLGPYMQGYYGRGQYDPASAPAGAPEPVPNDLISGAPSSAPVVASAAEADVSAITITHRERVADIIAPTDSKFHGTEFQINPGLERTFPWLSQLAANYEEFEFEQIVFEYEGHQMVGLKNTLDLQGQIICATQYNVKAPSFTDRHEIMAYPHANHTTLNGRLAHGVEADPAKISGEGHKYVRLGGLETTDDVRDYDHAKFTLAQNNVPSDLYGKEIGQLFVYYTVKLMKPKLSAGRGDAISSYVQYCNHPAGNGNANLSPFGDEQLSGDFAALVVSKNTLDLKFESNRTVAPTWKHDPNDPTSGTANYGLNSQGDQRSVWTFPPDANGVYRITATAAGSGLPPSGFATFRRVGEVETRSLMYPKEGTDAGYDDARHFAGTDVIMLVIELVVRPQIGKVPNQFIIESAFDASGGGDDLCYQTSFVCEEIQTFGKDKGIKGAPELKEIKTGIVRLV